MTKVALTGGDGFLGFHTRVALLESGAVSEHIPVGDDFSIEAAANTLEGAERFIHLAGVNRASDQEVHDGNVGFAKQIADALVRVENPPKVIAYANSIQALNDSVYGKAKAEAGAILAAVAERIGSHFVDVRLPNLFGEHGRPFYNAVTSTFCHLLAEGGTPQVKDDRELTLLHAQNAADLLTGAAPVASQGSLEVAETVSGLLARLESIAETYSRGEIPDISDPFDRDLFNTYRSYTFESLTPISLTRHADQRGSFFEIIRAHGGSGQASFSTTASGISRGDHFHRRKVERFTVLAGKATISLRRLFTNEVYAFDVTGDEPVAIDMPTGWAHKLVNTGEVTLYTSFWSNEVFDPQAPDTIAEAV